MKNKRTKKDDPLRVIFFCACSFLFLENGRKTHVSDMNMRK
ncbi:hypothetical protein D922_02344 [Enterococcus faecalis 06-MB-DW-09]|nr:hypothetical protein D922_02344 [Enterococcus faecalis 06-MB-DW-09]